MSEHHCGITDCWRKDTTYISDLEMWLCGEHASEDDKATPPKPSSDDVERAATPAWNEALEEAAFAMSLAYGSDAAERIRALKRTP